MTSWILPSNEKYYNLLEALSDLGTITWRFPYARHEFAVGDTVYVYAGKPKQRLTAVLRAENLPSTEIDDSSYYAATSTSSKQEQQDKKKTIAFTADLKLMSFVPHAASRQLMLSDLIREGLKSHPMRMNKLPTVVAEYIEGILSSVRRGADDVAEGLEIDSRLVRELEGQIEEKDYAVEDEYSSTKTRGSAQYVFAKQVKNNYGYKCAVTGISTPEFLIASHIVPWAMDKRIRLDPSNGICLSVLVDKAFETGALVIDETLEISVSVSLAESDSDLYELLRPYQGTSLRRPLSGAPNPEYLLQRMQLSKDR